MSESEYEERGSGRHRVTGRRSSSRHGRRKKENRQQTANRLVSLAIASCIVLILLVASYMLGKQKASQGAAKGESTPTNNPQVATLGQELIIDEQEWENQSAKRDEIAQLIREDRLERATILLDEMIEAHPAAANLKLMMAEVTLLKDGQPASYNLIKEAIRDGVDIAKANRQAAAMSMTSDQVEASDKLLMVASQYDPFNAELYGQWGYTQWRLGTLDKAADKYETALTLSKNEIQSMELEIMLGLLKLEQSESTPESPANFIPAGKRDDPAWKIVSAAVDLKNGDKDAASEKLNVAKRQLPEELFTTIISAPFFDYYRIDPKVSDMLEVR